MIKGDKMFKALKARRLSSMGQRLLSMGRPGEGMDYLEGAVRLTPEDVGLRIQYARGHAASGNFDDAVIEIQKAGQSDPENPALPLFSGIFHFDMMKYERAIEDFRECLGKKPSNLLATNYRDLALYASGAKKSALASFRTSKISCNIGFLSRFCALFETEMHGKARDLSSEVATQRNAGRKGEKPGYFERRRILRSGIRSLEKKDFPSAVRDFGLLIEHEPGHATACFGLALALTELSRLEQAKNLILDYLDVRGEMPEPPLVAWLGRLYIMLRDYDKGISILSRVPREGPEDYNVNYFTALGYLFRGDRKKAFEYFERAFRFYFVDTFEDCFKPLFEKVTGAKFP